MTQFNFADFDIISVCCGGEAAMYLNKSYITFTRALLAEMGYPPYVRLLLSPKKHIFALQACGEHDCSAFRFSRPKDANPNARYTSSQSLRAALAAAMGESYQDDRYYGFKGTFDGESKAMIFNLDEAYVRNVHVPQKKTV